MFKLLIAMSALVVATSSSAEPADYTTSEQAFETTSDLTLLPTSIPGTVTARGCTQCEVIVLEVTSETRLLAGKDPVSGAELKKLAANNRNMAIFYDPKTKKAKRIVVYGVKAATSKAVAVEKRK
jgi:hypothetical protein